MATRMKWSRFAPASHWHVSSAISGCCRRWITKSAVNIAKGFCFDIDGVLLRGYTQLPHARDTLLALVNARVPFLLVTNGGGEVESAKALSLSKVLGVRIHPEQLIISSTPLRPVAAALSDRKCLILGCRDVVGVARSYGIRRPITVPQLAADDPTRYPFRAIQHVSQGADREEPFGAVFVLHDPNDYADLQIALDVLRGGWPIGSGGNKQVVPYYISNNDLVFAGMYPVPRLAGGSFTVALSALWQAVTGTDLAVTVYGKPSLFTSRYAAAQLGRWAIMSEQMGYHSWAEVVPGDEKSLTGEEWEARARQFSHFHSTSATLAVPTFDNIYMVGDNPKADVALARNAGKPWVSVLVRTGVFSGGSNDPVNPADFVVDGVREAVQAALQ